MVCVVGAGVDQEENLAQSACSEGEAALAAPTEMRVQPPPPPEMAWTTDFCSIFRTLWGIFRDYVHGRLNQRERPLLIEGLRSAEY